MQPQRGAFKASWALSPLFIALCLPPQLHQAALLQKPGTKLRAALPSAGLGELEGSPVSQRPAGSCRQLPWLSSAQPLQSRVGREWAPCHTQSLQTHPPQMEAPDRSCLTSRGHCRQEVKWKDSHSQHACSQTQLPACCSSCLAWPSLCLSVLPARCSPPACRCNHPGSSDHGFASMALTVLQVNYEMLAPK